jgi:hypothetical protein
LAGSGITLVARIDMCLNRVDAAGIAIRRPNRALVAGVQVLQHIPGVQREILSAKVKLPDLLGEAKAAQQLD